MRNHNISYQDCLTPKYVCGFYFSKGRGRNLKMILKKENLQVGFFNNMKDGGGEAKNAGFVSSL